MRHPKLFLELDEGGTKALQRDTAAPHGSKHKTFGEADKRYDRRAFAGLG